jgi:hypothetical protein
LALSFPVCNSFVSFSCLAALAKNSSTVWTKSGEWTPLSLSGLRGNVSSFLFSMMFGARSHYHVSSVPSFFRTFIMSGFWILSKAFFCIYWDHQVFLSFSLLMYCIMLINLHVLSHPCTPGMKPTCSWF